MKKYIYLIILSLLSVSLFSQEKIMIHNNGNIMYESFISDIDSIKFKKDFTIFNFPDGINEIYISEIDSITFGSESVHPPEDAISITYNGDNVTIINPFEDQGVNVITNEGNVTITSTSKITDMEYYLSGTTENGSLEIISDNSIIITLNNVSINNPVGPAINITKDVSTIINIASATTNVLTDGSENSQKATLLSLGELIFEGTGRLSITGIAKHAICTNTNLKVAGGLINILQAASDGFHVEGFTMDGGSLNISPTEGDGIDAGAGNIEINTGNIVINSTSNDVKGIKCDGNLTINDGSINMTIAGAQSKGLSSKSNIIFNGGTINIIASGAAVLESSGSGYDPSYCSAVKADGDIIVNGSNITVENTDTNDGGKCFSSDGNIYIYNGTVSLSTAGNGTTYTNEEGSRDSYTSCCLKSNGDILLSGGNITCVSSGAGGKGISADGTLIIGNKDDDNNKLIINVTTSGERFYVSGSGDSADYANPKAIKSEGNLTVNSGIITINCTQSDEGGEGLESKDVLTINGGEIQIKAYDDCINASNHIEITDGTVYCTSTGNDAIDSNGTLSISGGFIIANGTRSPEGGFDCDNSRFAITGGVIIGTGGSTSNPTTNASTQYSIRYSGTAGNAICIKNSSDEIILLYQMPTYTGSGSGGGPGGGGPGGGNSSSMIVLFSDPNLTPGNYTMQYGGTISGGTTINGYNTGGTYSGGSSRNFTISTILTTIN